MEEIVKEALHYRDGRVFDLHAFCIMANHVHTVFAVLSRSECYSDLRSECHSDLLATLRACDGKILRFWSIMGFI